VACLYCGGAHPSENGSCPALGPWAGLQPLPSLAPGQILEGKYRIVRELGRGGMGVVHEALHMTLGRRIAVKTLLAEAGQDPDLAARFEREARAASAIGHPHIVDVFDLGRTPEGLLFMALELLDGKPLAALLEETPSLPIPLALDLAGQMLSGLAAAHRNGIVHRDLKPENIFILNTQDRPNFVKIVDFGISKILVHAAHGQRAAGQGPGTAVGTILGTPLYMSPEQILGQVARIDHRTDIYSAGVVLYEMLCGRTPFEGESHAKIFASILDGWYPLPHDLRRDIPANVEAAIVRALDRDMAKRFASAADMRDAVTGRSADVTPSPELLSDPFATQPTTLRQPSSVQRGDPFAPLPDQASIPLLSRDLEHPLADAVPQAGPPLELARPVRTSAPTMPRRQLSQASARPPRKGARVGLALGLVALIVGAGVAHTYLRSSGGKNAPIAAQAQHKVTLALDPPDATVQIDHVPAVTDDLFLDASKSHVLQATAPGRISRSFAFEAKSGLELSVHLGRALALPLPADPGPSPGELAVHSPANPASRDELNHAFAKLERYDRCLMLLGYTYGQARKAGNSAGPSNSDMSGCVQLLDEASTLAPVMFQLHAAGVAYVRGVQNAQSPAALHKVLVSFRGEFLAERARWQMEELSRQEKDEGRTAGWHMRQLALAAQTWLRQGKAASPSTRGINEMRAKLDQAHQALLAFAQRSPKELAGVAGAAAFMRAAEDVVALAQGESDKRRGAALAACAQLLATFNVLVVD
jgi:serine/threonine protein kinase